MRTKKIEELIEDKMPWGWHNKFSSRDKEDLVIAFRLGLKIGKKREKQT
jgi:hypothetical protein